jgi:hypothetical protein
MISRLLSISLANRLLVGSPLPRSNGQLRPTALSTEVLTWIRALLWWLMMVAFRVASTPHLVRKKIRDGSYRRRRRGSVLIHYQCWAVERRTAIMLVFSVLLVILLMLSDPSWDPPLMNDENPQKSRVFSALHEYISAR